MMTEHVSKLVDEVTAAGTPRQAWQAICEQFLLLIKTQGSDERPLVREGPCILRLLCC
jgi:hypothetical protein